MAAVPLRDQGRLPDRVHPTLVASGPVARAEAALEATVEAGAGPEQVAVQVEADKCNDLHNAKTKQISFSVYVFFKLIIYKRRETYSHNNTH